MNELKASLKLYLNSWKRSFDFFSEENKEELKNFIHISFIIGLILFISFFNLYEEEVILASDSLSTINNYFGVALFWCYIIFAVFPFAGIISRRLHSHNIDIDKLTTIFNQNGIIAFMAFCIFHFLISQNVEMLLDIPFIPIVSILLYPIYASFIPLCILCWNLSNTKKLEKKLEKKPINLYKFTIVFVLSIIFVYITTLTNSYTIFLCIHWVCIILFMCIQIIYITNSLILSSIVLFILSKLDLQGIPQLPYAVFIIFSPYLYALIKKINFRNKKTNFYLKLYTPLILVTVILPLNIANPSIGSLGLAKNFITNANYVKQDVNSIGDKNINSLSVPLLKTLSKEKQNQNFLISVHNLYQGLSLLANGATGNTLEKLKKLLGSQNLDEINAKSKEIIEHHSTALKLKNTLSITAKKHLNPQFNNTLKQYGNLKQKSNSNCKIYYNSSLEFASSWETKFGRNLTNLTFHTPSKNIKVPMMRDKREVYIAQGENFRVLSLPYKSGDIFYIILPSSKGDNSVIFDIFADKYISQNQNFTLDEVIEKLTPETFSNLKFEKHKLDLTIPVFEFSENINFKTALNSLELGNLFKERESELDNILSPSANTTDCNQNYIHIESFNQKNKIKVNEKGTAAISYQQIKLNYATGAAMDISEPFIVDRPFIFMINNGAFMGIINDPTIKGDSL